MPLMVWNDRMTVGVKVLDDDHKKLIAYLNELHDGIQAGHGRDVLGKILDRLIEYTASHFKREENFFASTGYPGATAHKAEHDKLTAQVIDVQKKYKASTTSTLSLEVMNFLRSWLTSHIQGSDKKYGPHLNGHGVH
jgi:hemerythrin